MGHQIQFYCCLVLFFYSWRVDERLTVLGPFDLLDVFFFCPFLQLLGWLWGSGIWI